MHNSRDNQFSEWGGDSTQIMGTKLYLEKKGLKVDLNCDVEPDLSNYNLLHIFNIRNPENSLKLAINAKKSNLPLALSTIYWDLSYGLNYKELHRFSQKYAVRLAAKINNNIPNLLSRFEVFLDNRKKFDKIRLMLNLADVILPNSYAELEMLVNKFKMPEIRKKALIVPNGVSMPNLDFHTTQIPSNVFELPEEYILEVGRVQTWKGQFNLIKALFDFPDIPLVFIGNNDSFYAKECIKLGKTRGNTYFLNEILHEDLHYYYANAKVHALPSLSETTGLSTLEAASFGANCVVSIHGPITEYFGFDAFICDPKNINSIKNAVLEAWNSPKSYKLKRRVLNKFNWEKAAEKTLIAYKHII